MKPANKVILNTGILYAQLIIGVVIGLFTTRIVLDALGETNFGIYMLVAGVVGMLGILNSNMANTSMRYMAHSMGTGDKEIIRKTFNTTLFLHFIIGAIVIVLMQIGGWLMFEYLLNIPPDKIFDAKVVFHFMVLTTFVTVIFVPYDAVINAHENMLALALVEILGHVLKLGVAIYLTISQSNLLILYGFFMLLIQVLLRIIKQRYSKAKYDECKIRFRAYVDKDLLRKILSFTGWNLFGSVGAMSVTQVRGVLLNMFFGVSLNAADGISRAAGDQVNMVPVSMIRALNPQLFKSEGGGNRERMLRITEVGTKFSAFLFALFAIPILFETSFLLNLWLKNVPDFAVIFFQILLANMMLEKLTFQITEAIRAVGRIRAFQVTETTLMVLSVPVAYFAFKTGFEPYAIYAIGIIVSSLLFFNRLYFGRRIAGLIITDYLKNAVLPIFIPLLLSLIVAITFNNILPEGFLRLALVTLGFCVSLTVSFWFLGVRGEEKDILRGLATSFLNKVRNILKIQ